MVLQLSLPCICTPVTHIFDLSLSEGIFTVQLKIANAIPIYTGDSTMHFNKYRPVSLLSIISKVFEKWMYSRLLDFLNRYNIYNKKSSDLDEIIQRIQVYGTHATHG